MSRGVILPAIIGIIFLGLIGFSQDAVADIVNTVDTTGFVGEHTSITIGADGFPIISYYDYSNGDLKLVHCTDTSCSTHDTPTALDTTGTVGFYTSITIGADGFPVISYYDSTNADLKVVYVQFEGTSEPEDKNNPCDALDKASDKGNGKKKGLEQAKSNNNC